MGAAAVIACLALIRPAAEPPSLLNELEQTLRIGVAVSGTNPFQKSAVEGINATFDRELRPTGRPPFPTFGSAHGVTYLGDWDTSTPKAARTAQLTFVVVLSKITSEEGRNAGGNYSNGTNRVSVKYRGAKASATARLYDVSDAEKPRVVAEWADVVDRTSAPGLVFTKKGESSVTESVTRSEVRLALVRRIAANAVRQLARDRLTARRAEIVTTVPTLSPKEAALVWALADLAWKTDGGSGADAELEVALRHRVASTVRKIANPSKTSAHDDKTCPLCGHFSLSGNCCDDARELAEISRLYSSLRRDAPRLEIERFPEGWPMPQ